MRTKMASSVISRWRLITMAVLGSAVSTRAQSVTSSASPPLGSVLSIFLLDTDPQPLVASYIGISDSTTTLAINCPPGASDDSCGYPEPFTIAFNPSTVQASAVYDGISIHYHCALTGTTAGSCTVTYAGAATDLAENEAEASTATGSTSVVTTGALAAADITLFPVTVTAGSPGQASAAPAAGSGSNSEYDQNGSDSYSDSNSNGGSSSAQTSAAAPAGTAAVTGTGSPSAAATTSSNAGESNSKAAGISQGSSVVGGSSSSKAAGSSGPIASYSKAEAYKMAAPGIFGAAMLGLAAFL